MVDDLARQRDDDFSVEKRVAEVLDGSAKVETFRTFQAGFESFTVQRCFEPEASIRGLRYGESLEQAVFSAEDHGRQ